MEHPLISNIDHLTDEELQSKINDLAKKMTWAMRSGNGYLVSQIGMALETYRNRYAEKQQVVYEASRKAGNDYADKIDIS